jgi:hypothetical protein
MVLGRRQFLICIAVALLVLSDARYVKASGWSATFGTARIDAIYPTADSAYLMTSEDGRYLTKVSAAGEVIWSHIMQGVTRLAPAGAGFLAVVHNTNTLVYLNGLGEVVWWRTFNLPIYPTIARAFPDDTLLIGANVENRPLIAKLTSNGEVVWQMYVTLPGMTVSYLVNLLPLDDGNFLALMGGWQGEPAASSDFIVRFSGSGNVVWSRALEAMTDSARGATGITKLGKTAGGGYFAYGLSRLIAFDSVGLPTSYRNGLPYGENGIWPTIDGGYIAAGFDVFDEGEGAVVQKLDRQLNSDWRRHFGSGATSKLSSIAPTPAGGWIVGGMITPSGQSNSEGWVFRLASGGQPFGSCPDSVPSAPDLGNGIRQCEVQVTHPTDAPEDVPIARVMRCNLPSAPPGFSPAQQDFDFTCGSGAQPNVVRCTVTTRNNYSGNFDVSLSYGGSGNVHVSPNERASVSLAFPFDTPAGTYFVTTANGINNPSIASSPAAVSTQPGPALISEPASISWFPHSLSRSLLCSAESEVCPLASALDGKAELDSDGDSLSDCIEMNGVRDPNTHEMLVDLPALDANPYHKDVFVEVDYLRGLDHDHKLPEAIELAKQAMAALPVQNPDGKPGVNLHVDYGQSEWTDSESNGFPVFDNSLLTWSLVDVLKEWPVSSRRIGFSPYRRGIFHYCVFGYEAPRDDGENVLGAARWARHWAGTDFVVTLGNLGGLILTKELEAVTFLHELGHNLGLRHGGGDGVENKPNYRSVMNYLYSPTLHFSTAALPPPPSNPPHLDERHLDEGKGIGAAGLTVYYCPPLRTCPNPDFTDLHGGNLCVADDGRAIDWNCNGPIDAVDVGVNINGDYSDEPVPQPIMGDLLGFMDTTPIVNFDGIRPATAGLVVGSEPEPEPEPREITAEEYLAIPDPVHQFVEAVSPVVQLAWGETRPVAFRVSNIGIQDDTYDLFAYSTAGHALGGAPGPLTPAPIALDGGESALVEIAVTAPPAGVPGVSNLVLIVTGRRRPELADEIAVQIVVGSQVLALFSDGFESGDTGAWSGKSPP